MLSIVTYICILRCFLVSLDYVKEPSVFRRCVGVIWMSSRESVRVEDGGTKFAPGLPCNVRNAGLGCNIVTRN